MDVSAAGSAGTGDLSRRDFLRTAAVAAAVPLDRMPLAMTILDCHTHFYDPGRPQGVPWPGKADTPLYRPVYPKDYKAIAVPLGVTGTVVVEASAWMDDNQWVLDLAAEEPFIAGLVGRLDPGQPSFAAGLTRFAGHPLFRGIRVSGRDVARLMDPAVLRDLEALAGRNLALDLNGDVSSLPVVAAAARAVPALRIVIDHVANVAIDGHAPPRPWLDGMDAASRPPNVFCKVSGLVEGTGRRGGKAPSDTGFYRPVLDAVWERFGQTRVIYGSNWPVSGVFAPLSTVQGIVQTYVRTLGDAAERHYFADNAGTAYGRGGHSSLG